MSKLIEKGEVVKILGIHKDSVWSGKTDRKRFIGMEVKLTHIESSHRRGGWRLIKFNAVDNGEYIVMGAVKLRRVKNGQ